MHGSNNPFTRTAVIVTAIIAATVILGGVIAISAFSPDAGPRINSVLTITIPTCLIALVGVAVSVRNGRIVQDTRQQVASTQSKVDTVQRQTNGVTSKLLAHALGQETLDTGELKVIAAKVADNAAEQGGQ